MWRGSEGVAVAARELVGDGGLHSGEENRGGGECSGERMRTRESEGERQGGAWRLRASRRKQEVAEQGGGGARGGVAVSVLLAGRKTTGGVEMGWAGQVGLVGCGGKSR